MDEHTTTSPDDLAEALCESFRVSAATWSIENYTYASTVMFYLAALQLVDRKPFEPESVQIQVREYLQQKLDEATQQLLEPAMKRLGDVATQLAEMGLTKLPSPGE